MSLVTEQEAITHLRQHLAGVWGIVKGGWDDYLSMYSEAVRVIHDSTTRANIIHAHQIERASRYAQSVHDVRLADLSKLKVLVIDGKFAIRFKKFDDELRSANHPTRQVVDFRAQEQLAGLPPTYNLEAGYLLNQLETEIHSIYLVCPNRNGNYWAAELCGESATQTIFDLFEKQQVAIDDTEEANVVIRPRRGGVVKPIRRERDES